MNKTLKLTVFLAIVAAIATGILALVNSQTAPVIAANEASAQTAELEALYPDASNIEIVEDFTGDANGLVQEVYKVDDTAYAFKVQSKGYADDVIFLIGYNTDGSNSKFAMLQNNDTPGFGQKLAEQGYIDSMTGKNAADGAEMISGATVTSNAVSNGVNAAIEVFNSLTGNKVEASKPEAQEPSKPILSEQTGYEVTNTVAEGDITTYTVEGDNFYGDDKNVLIVKVNTASRTIESVVFDKFKDTEGIGDAANTADYLGKFAGLSIDESNQEFDVVSGATFTSKNIMAAVNAAIKEAGGQVSDTPSEGSEEAGNKVAISEQTGATIANKEVNGDTTVYTVETENFYGDDKNVFTITVNTANRTIDTVEFTKFKDTEGIGDAANTEEYLATFSGLNIDEASEADTVSGSTYTSKSIIAAVNAVIVDVKGQ